MSETINYKISVEKLSQHLLNVECRIKMPSEEGQIVSLPAWVPGSYMIRDFAKHLVWLEAESNGDVVATKKIDKNTWQCAPCRGDLIIRYQLYCFDLMPRGTYIDHTRVFFDGCRIFLVVDGKEEQTRSVEIVRPVFEQCKNWRCATSMTVQHVDRSGFGTYTAYNHLDLIDHPFEISDFQQLEFTVADVPHILVVAGEAHGDLQRLADDVERVCNGHVEFFGEFPPMARYVFILNVLGKGYGGIEHRSSCTLLCARNDLPVLGDDRMSDEYKALLGLFSHEYFHLWNVKRIKPEVFTNPDLTAEVYTRQLWVFEGITSYYDNLNLVRNKIISASDYFTILQKDINSFLQNPGSDIQTLEESSFDAWIKFYQPDDNSPNATVSYYLKGSLVALCLDILIITKSRRKQSLADVLQVLWHQYGKTGLGLPENYFERVTYEVIGEDYSEFFDLALRTTEPLPLQELLLEIGLVFKLKPADFLDNLGLKLAVDQNKLIVRTVINGSVLEQAGLAPNDNIIAVNNIAVNLATIENVLKRFCANKIFSLQIFRNEFLMDLEVFYPENTKTVCELEPTKTLTEQQNLNWHKWLESA